jgi:hypothetical protein
VNGVRIVFGLGLAHWRTIYLSTGSDFRSKPTPSRRLDRKRVITKVVAGIGFEPVTFGL